MTATKLLHSAKINNNCPYCFNTEGLEFTFIQEAEETRFYKKTAKNMQETLFCHNCDNKIYPERWDKHIELVYEYHKKIAQPKHTGMTLKPLSIVLIVLTILLIATAIYFALR